MEKTPELDSIDEANDNQRAGGAGATDDVEQEGEDEDSDDLFVEQYYQDRPEYPWRDPEVLKSYVVDGYTVPEIADRLFVSESTIRDWLDHHDLPTPKRVKYSELRDQEWLREQYVEKKKTQSEIASELGCNQTTVGDWLRRHGIETRGPGGEF